MHRLTILGVTALALLCVLCPIIRAPAIEEDIRNAAEACAEEVGLESNLISVSGRDVTLVGTLTSEALSHHLMSCIAAFPGTRAISNQLEVLVSGALSFRTHYGEITVSGVVPTAEARTAILEEAVALWGAENVTDEVEVDPGRTIGEWPNDEFTGFLGALRHSRRDLDIELSGGKAVVGGTVLSHLARIRVLGAAGAMLPGFEIVDRLTIRDPATPRETLQARLDNLLEGRVVEFEADSANLTPNGRRVLDRVITILRENPGRIEISGHTDSTGPITRNLDLSRSRAETVARYFIAKGFDVGRFEVVGYGPSRPIATDATPEGQRMNRRIELHALMEDRK
jgi:OOP family OmpA-OmpF porin